MTFAVRLVILRYLMCHLGTCWSLWMLILEQFGAWPWLLIRWVFKKYIYPPLVFGQLISETIQSCSSSCAVLVDSPLAFSQRMNRSDHLKLFLFLLLSSVCLNLLLPQLSSKWLLFYWTARFCICQWGLQCQVLGIWISNRWTF